jgi:hypothetical protein
MREDTIDRDGLATILGPRAEAEPPAAAGAERRAG